MLLDCIAVADETSLSRCRVHVALESLICLEAIQVTFSTDQRLARLFTCYHHCLCPYNLERISARLPLLLYTGDLIFLLLLLRRALLMAHEDGWPLGLGLGTLNPRAGAVRSVGSSSSSTAAFTPSHCVSSVASSDLDTESAWSLPHAGRGGSITLAALIGLVDAMESRRSRRPGERAGRGGKLRALLLSLCLRSHLENGGGAAPSLGQFLEMERRASGSSGHLHRMLPWNRA
ncbi:hypothetical protein D1007_55685 [Hordeum vulgare]|nr:hypothetical protein D1007_55685 [Hordeum vulgare]